MRAHRFVPLAGIAAGLVGLLAAGIAVLGTAATSEATRPTRIGAPASVPLAVAAGDSGGPVVHPGLVSVHFDRLVAAVAEASSRTDANDVTGAISSVKVANVQVKASWVATKYLIAKTPPPVVGEDRAGAGGAPPAGAAFAAPPDTALQFFDLQHDFAAAAAGLLGNRPVLNSTLVAALQANSELRSTAVEHIHRTEPPPVVGEDRAGASGAPVASTFGSVMPTVVGYLDDELMTLRGTLKTYKSVLTADIVAALKAQVKTVTALQTKINTYWPPLPADD